MNKALYSFLFLVLFIPAIVHAGELDLKSTSQEIIDYELSTTKAGQQVVKYSYKTKEAPIEPYEDIEKRTANTQYFGNKVKIYLGDQFIKEGDKWYQTEVATTTLKTWDAQYDKPFTFINTARADNYYVGDGGSGYCATSNKSSWATAHDAVSADSCGNTQTIYYVDVNYNGATSWYLYRVFIPVDTSAIDDGATIESAKFYFYPTRVQNDDNDANAYLNLVETTETDPTALATGDYSLWTTTELGTPLDNDTITINAYNYIELNATGLEAINKTGWTKLALLEGHDINDDALSTQGNEQAIDIRSSRYADTTYDPYLEITLGAGEPPVEPPVYGIATSTSNMNIETIIYTATTTLVSSTTSVLVGTYQIPFLLYIFVFTAFCFALFCACFFYFLTHRKKY